MEWDKQLIEINNLPQLRIQLQAKVKDASPNLEQIKCIFGYKETTTVYVYTVFDFLDNYDTIIQTAPIEKFYIYQLIDKKSIS